MSRTVRDVSHLYNISQMFGPPNEEHVERYRRGRYQPENLYWIRNSGGQWGWPDDVSRSPAGRRWVKRMAAKVRRRLGHIEIQQQLDEQHRTRVRSGCPGYCPDSKTSECPFESS